MGIIVLGNAKIRKKTPVNISSQKIAKIILDIINHRFFVICRESLSNTVITNNRQLVFDMSDGHFSSHPDGNMFVTTIAKKFCFFFS